MCKPIGSMVSKLFYGEELRHAPSTELVNRPLSRQITQFLSQKYDVNSPLMIYAIKGVTQEDHTKSQYNIANASLVLNLMIKMIEEGVVKPSEVVIMTFYRAQLKIYQQALRSLSLAHPNMVEIRVYTVDKMQGSQAPFIIMDIVVTKRMGFLGL